LRGPLFTIVYAALIVGCTFFYTAFLIDPDAAAATLERRGASIPGVAVGEATAEHIDEVITRLTMIGAAYLALVYLLPAALVAMTPVPFYFGGASLLIVVCAILDLEAHIRGFGSVKTGV
jgi:preprotein translocase subunit SecY